MKNPWVIVSCVLAVVGIFGLVAASAVALEAVKSDETEVLVPALIGFASVSLTLLATTLIPTLMKASATEATVKRAAESVEGSRKVLEEVHSEVNGKMAAKIEDGARRVVREEVPAMIEAGVRKVLREMQLSCPVEKERPS